VLQKTPNQTDAALISAPVGNTPHDLTALRLALHANGYHPVPVIGKAPKMPGWQTKCLTATEQQISGWSYSQRNCTGTGILCGKLVGVDIDVLDEALSDRLIEHAQEVLGATPLRRIGKAPKTLLLYRVETPHRKLTTPELIFGDDVSDKSTKAKVEILAEGQQFVAFGLHPETQAPYRWGDRNPLDTPAADVPLASLESLNAFVTQAERILRDAGGRTSKEVTGHIKEKEQQGCRAAGVRHGERPSREKIADALDHIVNDLSYEDWIRIGFAIYSELGDSGRDLWENWSATYPNNDPRCSAVKWPSFKNGRSVTIGTLFWFAKQNGWWWKDSRDQPSNGPAEVATAKPVIRITGGNLPGIVDQAEQSLIDGDFSLYQRGSLLVRPAPVPVDIADNRTTTAIRLAPVKSHLLVELMTRAADWQRFDMRKDDWVPIDCPERVANTLLAREQWGLPVLLGIVNCPVLRPDGSVVETPGYDEATGLLYDPQGVEFDRLPDSPDKAAARRALDVLIELISTFPFVSGADRSVALSAILTAIHRRALPTAPLHGFTAPGAGSGKSKLVDIASLIVDGREAAVMSLGRSEEESEKRLGSALLAGDSIVSVDNIDPDRAFGGDLFCQALTQRMLKVRVLGMSKNVDVPSNAAVFANGNNLTLVGDMTRRAVVCTIDSGMERPELRVFDRDPLAMVRANRNKYVIAALTVLRGFYAAGCPVQLTQEAKPKPITPLGSFEEWSRVVRGALIWLGEADPCDTMEKVRKNDPKLAAMIAVVSQWRDIIGPNERLTAKDLIDRAVEKVGGVVSYGQPPEFSHPDFRDALLIVAGEGGAINSLKLGKWLAANQGRFVMGYKIAHAGDRVGSKLWRLEPKSSDAGLGDDGQLTAEPQGTRDGNSPIRTNF
jgi:putative DNA primase/helicase